MIKILFIDNPEYLKAEDVIWFDVPENKGKEDLISSIEHGLGFWVAGTNWDSLDENLQVLEWAKKNKIVINHKKIPLLNEKDLKIYLSILNEDSFLLNIDNKKLEYAESNIQNVLKSNIKWALIAIFPTKFKGEILGIINGSK